LAAGSYCAYRALENLSSLEEVRGVLRDEVQRYNNHQVHSTTHEIPSIRFENARRSGNSLFRPFSIPKPYSSPKDIFCLRETRIVDGYCRISVYNHQIDLPQVPLREDVDLHLIPDPAKQVMEVRVWWNEKMVHSTHIPLPDSKVHI
jgi:hypothetical protein